MLSQKSEIFGEIYNNFDFHLVNSKAEFVKANSAYE